MALEDERSVSGLEVGGSGIVGPFLVPRSFRSTNADTFLHNRINRGTSHDTYDT